MEERTATLAATNDALRREVEERQRAEAALREADRRKDQFVMMLAHELRNPLAPIRNGLQLLQASGHDGQLVEQARTIMARQIGHMSRIIDDLLDVSRLLRGRVELHPQRIDLSRFVRTALEDQRPELERAGLSPEADLPELPAWVNADPTRLTQVFDNLVQNAVKFTDRGGTLSVRVEADAGRQRAVLTVRDTGVGIERGLLPHLFETFIQGDHSWNGARCGLGLRAYGWSGAPRNCRRTGRGRSGGPGRGAEFIVVLPLQPEPAAVAVMPSAPRRAASGCGCWWSRTTGTRRTAPQDAAGGLRVRLNVPTACLWRRGGEGVEAGCRPLRHRPSRTGRVWGARELRRNPATAKARMIAVTGYGSEEDRHKTARPGSRPT